MTVQNLSAQPSFITKDGSTIRSILDRTNAPVQNQSLAEARIPADGRTERHYHKVFHPRRRGRDGARRRTSHGPPGRCHPRPAGRVAHDHCCRAAALSLLLCAALFARGYVFRVTGTATAGRRKLRQKAQRVRTDLNSSVSCGAVAIEPCVGAALCYHASICDDLFLGWFSRGRAWLSGRCRRWRSG